MDSRTHPSLIALVGIGISAVVSGCSPARHRPAWAPGGPAVLRPAAATRPAEPAVQVAPATTRADAASPMDEVVAKLDSSSLEWSIMWWPDETEPQSIDVQVRSELGRVGLIEVAFMLFAGKPPAADARDEGSVRRLVKAMDDPAKIVAAHCELDRRGIHLDAADQELPGVPNQMERRKPPAEPFLYNFHGLAVELTPSGKPSHGTAAGGLVDFYACDARIDPAQFPSLRARWQKRLQAGKWK